MRELISNRQQWVRYTLRLDTYHELYFNHQEPERFPVWVESERDYDDDDGRIDERNLMRHTFTYQQHVKCDHCGHVKVGFPDEI